MSWIKGDCSQSVSTNNRFGEGRIEKRSSFTKGSLVIKCLWSRSALKRRCGEGQLHATRKLHLLHRHGHVIRGHFPHAGNLGRPVLGRCGLCCHCLHFKFTAYFTTNRLGTVRWLSALIFDYSVVGAASQDVQTMCCAWETAIHILRCFDPELEREKMDEYRQYNQRT